MLVTTPVPAWSSLVPPAAPMREWLMERFFRAFVSAAPVRVAFPGGEVIGRGGPSSPIMRVIRPSHLFRRLAVVGPIGLGEAYMAGDWTSTDPAGLLTPFAARLKRPPSRMVALLRRRLGQARPDTDLGTPDGARSNARKHYDLSNDLFALFLDESMTYSAALFGPDDDLHSAQLRKIDAVLDDARVGKGTRLLEIGSGWGELALRAARRGASVITVTLSSEQQRFVRERLDVEGLSDSVRVVLQDYREIEGSYDAVVSVEMIEAVGSRYWPDYFAVLDRVLAPGGALALQAITMPHERMSAMRGVHTWIGKHIFPGGQLPSMRVVEEGLRIQGLRIAERRSLGQHYARTLDEWRNRFLAHREQVASAGFDDGFQRMWDFYLAYSEAGFRSGFLNVWQLRVTR
ncbi:class I SAM-dependent methyltransferase [Actinosynnema sp. NPDC050801]|uniref:class I SAM-dependent methyltransferase n=1 Tax=unclassified Actinosynnema TaxID=2637065 RepID=UPI00340B10C6